MRAYSEDLSTSRKVWVGFFGRFEGVLYNEVALQRPLLAAPQSYLRHQDARARFVRNDSYHPRSPLHLLEQAYPACSSSVFSRGESWDSAKYVKASPLPASKTESAFGKRLRYTSANSSADRKSTRLNSSHANISYAVFCLK